jgi:hypothetical protein
VYVKGNVVERHNWRSRAEQLINLLDTKITIRKA